MDSQGFVKVPRKRALRLYVRGAWEDTLMGVWRRVKKKRTLPSLSKVKSDDRREKTVK
jgi:hypothetical protein